MLNATTEVTMIAAIDYGLCEGCGGCTDAYPQYFSFRDEKAWVIAGGSFQLEDRRGVLTVCPYYAITVE